MKNKKVGLALGGGSARGLAHIGVIQVLKENNIPIDAIAGCSMGAIVGSAYCADTDIYMLGKLVGKVDYKSLFDFGVHKKGLMKGDKFEQLAKILTKEKKIEDLSVPFAATSCEIQKAELVIIKDGPAYQAVRASISIPAMFVPYEIDGRQFVDGGVMERVPVNACRSLGADVVIAVEVGYSGQEGDYTSNVFEVVARVLDIMQWEISKDRISGADITLFPEVSHIKPYSNVQTQECIELGRQAAIKALPEINALLEENEITKVG